jgi:hypothetical protein
LTLTEALLTTVSIWPWGYIWSTAARRLLTTAKEKFGLGMVLDEDRDGKREREVAFMEHTDWLRRSPESSDVRILREVLVGLCKDFA